ncbi:unnamed protein product [Phyllotreta striolata]|uniref:[histone H3]-lysine(36) N-trimethyltransferase n=1 Tax=Phyllotreta striolata TaxID=444603 RepID=A0A9N9XJ46_PHYSR|nr:unnamed protein product [Phyllotreta striolata]
MPPKRKKKVAVHVVGTVSTRSTRRQSVVNIDIPKPKAIPKNKSGASPENLASTKDAANAEHAEEFTEQIKCSFDTLVNSSPQTSKVKQGGVEKDNRALLEILQDWDDEEDDDSTDNVPTQSTQTSSITTNNQSSDYDKNKCELSENKQMELMLSEGLEEEDVQLEKTEEVTSSQTIEEYDNSTNDKDDFKVSEEDSLSRDVNIESPKDENSTSLSGGIQMEEVIIEENASVPFADDILIVESQENEQTVECEQENTVLQEEVIEEKSEQEIPDTPQVVEYKPVDDQLEEEKLPVQSEEMDCSETAIVENKESVQLDELENVLPDKEPSIIVKDTPEKMECESEDVNQCKEDTIVPEDNKEKVEEMISDAPMNFSMLTKEEKEEIYEHLENKVAEMNLAGKSVDTTLISGTTQEKADSTLELKLDTQDKPKKSQKKKERSIKKTSNEAKVPKSPPKLDKDNKVPNRQPKTKPSKPSKLPTFRTKKERKPREPKTKKSTTSEKPKKPKDNSKEQDKPDPKKSDKKLTKFEEALQGISKTDTEGEEIRRSSRIKHINVMNKKTSGWGLVKSKSETSLNDSDISDSNSFLTESDKSTPTASPKVTSKERKSKVGNGAPESPSLTPLKTDNQVVMPFKNEFNSKQRAKDPIVEARLKQFVHLKENLYKTDRSGCKEAKKMLCDCFLTQEELDNNDYGCGEECLNRLLLIECGNLCTVGDRCTNKRFQKNLFAPVEVFNTEKKGLGLRAAANIPFGEFILEYVGEVLNIDEFEKRAEGYSQDQNIHYYFMALRADAVIDATMKGNISRFINHSCDPNAETQKWTVNGELRIGFFSTRTILAGEEITFDYRFQRYGKEAQKCYCGASICRGWLGEQPDSDDEEEEEEEEEEEDGKSSAALQKHESDAVSSEFGDSKDDLKKDIKGDKDADETSSQVENDTAQPKSSPIKRRVQKKKPRIEMFEEIDQLNEEIDMLVTTGLKNQAHTLKLSRLMVRAKEPQQRAKLLRVLRRGELPCRRLFLDYHGLRLMHGYMIDAQQLVHTNKKFESVRLEMLQTLAVLPIPNKTMLQDSKVLSTVEKWASNKNSTSPDDSESNSPKDADTTLKPTDSTDCKETIKEESSEKSAEDQEEEIRFLASKLLEEWKNLKEVFRIPKKERIEQMKEHEREANKKFMQTKQNTYESEDYRKIDRYRGLTKSKVERDSNRRPKLGDKPSAEFLRLSKVERRKLFALQHELKEEERKLKQREMWRQHEMNCMLIGADPRFTAPFDPSRGYQYIWNQQIGQWQTVPLQSNPRIYHSQTAPHMNMTQLPHIQKSLPNYQYPGPINMQNNLPMQIPTLPQTGIQAHLPPIAPNPGVSQMYPGQAQIPLTTPPLPQIIQDDPSQVKFMGPIPPPAKLPPKWKCAKDKYGRPYYYHVKIRKSQWEPPPLPPELSESESSSESSTVSSDSSSDNSDSDDDIDDTKLLLEVRRQMDSIPSMSKALPDETLPETVDDIPAKTPSPDEKLEDIVDINVDELKQKALPRDEDSMDMRPSIDMRLKELDLFNDDKPPKKKRRVGLCEEIIISPRTEEDKKQFKEDLKRYKANKEKLKRQKEKILMQTKKQLKDIEMKKVKEKRLVKVKLKEKPDFNSEAAKKIKENFRTNMASTVVGSLNVYRKPDCMEGRITNNQDFKHLARKLTHFVMLKEMKHLTRIEDLTCTDNVKTKAREFIRKYMSKFGEVYIKRSDSPEFKD